MACSSFSSGSLHFSSMNANIFPIFFSKKPKSLNSDAGAISLRYTCTRHNRPSLAEALLFCCFSALLFVFARFGRVSDGHNRRSQVDNNRKCHGKRPSGKEVRD